MSKFLFSKNSSLKNASDIDAVFKHGHKVSSEFISLYYVDSSSKKLKIAFSVGKKSHGLASTRNKLKRLMKEAFRLNAGGILGDVVSYNFVFVFFGSDKVSFVQVEECMKSLLLSFIKKVSS
tara:strand:- start:1019 stop:1384 length:366 start_codon:yes stop_codon:yes gene_type:complete